MSGGSLELQSSNFSITNEKDDDSSKTDFVDAREDPKGLIPNNQSSKESQESILHVAGKTLPPTLRRMGVLRTLCLVKSFSDIIYHMVI